MASNSMSRIKQLPSQCEDCGKVYKYQGQLKRHHQYSLCGGRHSQFPCKHSECGKTFKNITRARDHYRKEHLVQLNPSELPKRCEYPGCGKIFSRPDSLKSHHRTQHSGEVIEFYCKHPECGTIYKTSYGLKLHYQSKHSDQKIQFPCKYPGCGSVFTQNSGAEYHYRTEHSPTSFQCKYPECGKILKSNKNLKKHHEYHYSGPKVKCNFPGCGRMFYTRNWQRRHYQKIHKSINGAHPEQAQVACEYPGCIKSYTTKGVRQHFKKKHLTNERFRCEYCLWEPYSKTSYSKHLLKAHDQRQLLIIPPQPNMDISTSEFISQRQSTKTILAKAPMWRNSDQLITAENQGQSLYKASLDSRIENSAGVSTLTVREQNEILSK